MFTEQFEWLQWKEYPEVQILFIKFLFSQADFTTRKLYFFLEFIERTVAETIARMN